MSALFALIMAVSQFALTNQCSCPAGGVTEHYADGSTFVGATSPVEEAGIIGITIKANGDLVFENHAD